MAQKWSKSQDTKYDKAHGIKEGSKRDQRMDAMHGVSERKIMIKPSHRGLFSEKARKAGLSPSQYASKVLGNKTAYPSSTVKQANFDHNFAQKKR